MDKTKFLAFLVLGTLATSIIVYAGPSRPGEGTPFGELWDEIQRLREEMLNLSNPSQPYIIDVQGVPGPQGEPGPEGPPGPQGEPSEVTVIVENDCCEMGGGVSLSVDSFLDIDGIDGESTEDNHEDWIEVLGFEWGVSQPSGSNYSSGGRTSGRADFQDFTVVKYLDKASPKLALHVANGQIIPKVELELIRAEGNGVYMKYELQDVLVTSVRNMGGTEKETGGEMPIPTGERPIEEVTFAYGRIKWTYTEYDELGNPQGNIESQWNLETNTGG